jgi:curli production assembly/transport component CsgG
MKRLLVTLTACLALVGCSSIVPTPTPEPAKPLAPSTNKEFTSIAAPSTGKVVVAVYGFTDKTGQRKPSDKLAQISFAVTQGAESMLIEALKGVAVVSGLLLLNVWD